MKGEMIDMGRITEVTIDLHDLASRVTRYLIEDGLFRPETPEHVKEAFETDVFNSITQEGTDIKIRNILTVEIADQFGRAIAGRMEEFEEEDGEELEHDLPDNLVDLLEMLKRITGR